MTNRDGILDSHPSERARARTSTDGTIYTSPAVLSMQPDPIIREWPERHRGIFTGRFCQIRYDRKFRKATWHAANAAALVAVNTLSL